MGWTVDTSLFGRAGPRAEWEADNELPVPVAITGVWISAGVCIGHWDNQNLHMSGTSFHFHSSSQKMSWTLWILV